MSPNRIILLKKECTVFTAFLVRQDANDYVMTKYVDAHRVLGLSGNGAVFDRLLVGSARLHPVVVRLADAYARVFRPTAELRSKLVLLLAILESCPPYCASIDFPTEGTPIVVVTKIFGRTLGAAVSVAAGAVIFLPLQMICLLIDGRAR